LTHPESVRAEMVANKEMKTRKSQGIKKMIRENRENLEKSGI